MSRLRVIVAAVAGALLLLGPARAQQPDPYASDPLVGDYEGTLRLEAGGEQALCAQVICWGAEGYQANLLAAFDQPGEPLAVLRGGVREGETVRFGDGATLADGTFRGTLTGDRAGAFELTHVVRLSPTLGATPPADAVVLFDGTSLAGWTGAEGKPYVLDLSGVLPGDNVATYMRCRVTSPTAQPARLQLGSDDGVKAWLNGALVHANNTNRACNAWDDEVDVDLLEGENTLLLKVLQGGGGYGGCARVVGRDGAPLEGLSYAPAPVLAEGTTLADYTDGDPGAILTWEVAGPYRRMGRAGFELFDVRFAPEIHPDRVAWTVINDRPRPIRSWRLVGDGSMEVGREAGSIVTRREFTDFRLHLEFRVPFMPDARGQMRGNSGVYLQGRYEIQVLDSYGLPPRYDDCGGFYGVAAPAVMMAAPPTQWQTYDIEFRAPRRLAASGLVSHARVTVRHNGVLIHDGLDLGGDLAPGQEVQKGGLYLQDHWFPVQYRNVWIAPLTPGGSVTE